MVTAKNILLCTWHCCRTLYYYLSLYNSKDTDSCHMGVGKISTILLKTELTLCTQLPPQFTHIIGWGVHLIVQQIIPI